MIEYYQLKSEGSAVIAKKGAVSALLRARDARKRARNFCALLRSVSLTC